MYHVYKYYIRLQFITSLGRHVNYSIISLFEIEIIAP